MAANTTHRRLPITLLAVMSGATLLLAACTTAAPVAAPAAASDAMMPKTDAMTKPADTMTGKDAAMPSTTTDTMKKDDAMMPKTDAMTKPADTMTGKDAAMPSTTTDTMKKDDAMMPKTDAMTKPADTMIGKDAAMPSTTADTVKKDDAMMPKTDAMTKPADTMMMSGGLPKEVMAAHFTTSTPGHGATLTQAPSEVAIGFNAPLGETSSVTVTRDGSPVATGPLAFGDGNLSVRVPLTGGTGEGVYTVAYKACGTDRMCYDGQFGFTVGAMMPKTP